jgi:hypothetical protein
VWFSRYRVMQWRKHPGQARRSVCTKSVPCIQQTRKISANTDSVLNIRILSLAGLGHGIWHYFTWKPTAKCVDVCHQQLENTQTCCISHVLFLECTDKGYGCSVCIRLAEHVNSVGTCTSRSLDLRDSSRNGNPEGLCERVSATPRSPEEISRSSASNRRRFHEFYAPDSCP